jgi:ethanolamine utilization protein EutN
MQLGIVVEQVWLSRTPPPWQGHRLLGIDVERVDGSTGGRVIAADTLGARVGERVIVGSSSRVRDLVVGPDAPFKAIVVAIVDTVDRELPQMAHRDLRRSSRRREVGP